MTVGKKVGQASRLSICDGVPPAQCKRSGQRDAALHEGQAGRLSYYL